MIKVIAVFDNKFASPMTPLDFVSNRYLTQMGRDDLVEIHVSQGDKGILSGKFEIPGKKRNKKKV